MISFKAFLVEVKRTPERAEKLFNKLGARHAPKTKFMFHPGSIMIPRGAPYPHSDADNVYGREGKAVDGYSVSTQEIPVHKIKNTQLSINKDRAANMAHDYKPDHSEAPITVMKHGDNYHVVDGHHRLYANRALGNKTIKAHVYTKNG